MDKFSAKPILFCVLIAMLIFLFAVSIAYTLAFLCSTYSAEPAAQIMYYARTGEITAVDEPGNCLTIQCDNGYTYQHNTSTEDWMPGDLCTMVMFDTCTEDPSDDQILNIWYFGRIRLYE